MSIRHFCYGGYKVLRLIKVTILISIIILFYPFVQAKSETPKRAMTFLDVLQMRYLGYIDISPDGKLLIYTLSVPDWEKSKNFSDIHVVPLIGGKAKRLTFTKYKNENSPKWYKDSSFFAFLSDRSEKKTQIFFMNTVGDEARKITDDKFGVNSYEWSKDCKYLIYLGGEPDKRQIWIMHGKGGNAEKLTNHKTSISSYHWNPVSEKIYFTAIDNDGSLDKKRNEKGFDVVIKDEIMIPFHIWEFDIESREEKRLTGGNEYSVSEFIVSDDGTKIAFIGVSTKRYATWFNNEVYLLDLNTDTVSRITNNLTWESNLSFSPDSKWLAFNIENDEIFMNLNKIYIVPTGGGETKKLLNNFEYEGRFAFWNDDSRSIYFRAVIGVNSYYFRVSIDNDRIEKITSSGNCIWLFKDKDSGKFIIAYSDPENPEDFYYSEHDNFNDRDKWTRLTDSNPQVKDFLLGEYETIRWKSTDGTAVEGILIKPSNYKEGIKYPLIVQVHSGPFISYQNYFEASPAEYVHIYAANDYAVFQPNYRGSTGYGEEFKKEIAGDYFGQSFDDIMTGVDYLIKRGIVHPDSMGIMGWSAGGMFSNWALVSTDRFKAISTGAGVVNWISLYSQTRFVCEYYLQGTPYDNWDHYIDMSPLKYIKNAKTPTLIHFGENDRIIPRSQGEELYMALKKMGVPTEFIIYPDTRHNVSDMRYQMVKMQAEFNWFERWIRGKEGWINWKSLIETLEKE
jgi:dipeptidyl aminopeptidase/acylaminoacyl peptidase